MKIAFGSTTMAEQVATLGFRRVGTRSSLLLVFLKVVHSGETHAVLTAPAGKGNDDKVKVHEQYVAFEVNPDGSAKKGAFGSPRAVNVVEADYEEVPGKPGLWRKKSVTPAFLVPEDYSDELVLVTREGQEESVSAGDVISVDRDGYCHVIKKAKFAESFEIVE
jgi:hypothetical protein